jgi:D-lactate dehydrogenase
MQCVMFDTHSYDRQAFVAANARIMHGVGCRLLAADLSPNAELVATTGVRYVDLDELLSEADVISLHVPLTPATRHLIDARALERMKPGVVLINTSRDALIEHTRPHRDPEERAHAAGLDVYEEEEAVFFRDLSGEVLQDDVLARLMTFGNLLLTSHQGSLTREALANIAETTLARLCAFERGEPLAYEVRADVVLR